MIARTCSGSMMVGVGAWPLAPAEDAGRRNFVAWILGMSEKAEVARCRTSGGPHSASSPCGTSRRCADLGVPVTETLGEGGVLAEHPFLFGNFRPRLRCSATYLEMCVFSMTVLPAMAARSS
jgi:hypothetical protein